MTDKINTEKIKISGKENSIDIIDGTRDPNLNNMIFTKSYSELKKLMNPEYPINIFISGDTGIGKSMAVMHIRSEQNLPVVRVNLSFFTDLDDLIGGIRLVDGDTVFEKGPVIIALETPGCTLLLDEITQCNPRVLMDLQPILEKRGYLIKKTKQMIYPAKGFNVIATGNSRGVGDNSGQFVGENILNKATLDRFPIFLDYQSATEAEMYDILKEICNDLNDDIRNSLSKWYGQILESIENGVIIGSMSSRRMIDIGNLFLNMQIKDINSTLAKKALFYGVSAYDEVTSSSLLHLWDVMVIENVKMKKKVELHKKDAESQSIKIDSDTGKPLDEDGDIIPF